MIAQYRGVYSTGLPLPDEALSAFFEAWSPAPKHVETVSLEAALGRVLARDVRSGVDVPEHPRSAMDGFALRADDVRFARPAQPRFLTLVGEVRPGSRAALAEGTTVRIATGAPLPRGADAVVRLEDVFLDTSAVGISKPVTSGTDVIAVGEDIAAGATLAPCGTVLRAATLGVLAALGRERVEVYRRPAVALMSTGDEVVPVGASPRTGEVRDSNGVALAALLRSFGVETVTAVHARDDIASLEHTLARGVDAHDAVVLSGGSSVGARDLTTAVLAKREPPGVIVHGVRMKPGRPVLLAASGTRPIIGLPGNPTAAMLALMVLGPPIFAKLTGAPAASPSSGGIALEPLVGKTGWACYVPVRVDAGGGVRPVEHFCSTFLSSLVEADGYVYVDPSRASIAPGESVRVYRLP
ncbi:MAG TPA: molybdopterin molybdotransferase MoeA [Candidatus Limnocylindria bacterium]|jgi:molybdenum cofactor synthesis domain-containing protein|nr:molybdopterin molybdotransferase MoeA [Candidatus Limnocylindria bacterium]